MHKKIWLQKFAFKADAQKNMEYSLNLQAGLNVLVGL
jgi:hypothetical protein